MKKVPWKLNETIAAAKLSSRAGRRHVDRLRARGLDEAFFDELDSEVERLQELTAGHAVQLEVQRGKTRKLTEVVTDANRIANGIRQAILYTYPPKHWARAEFGLGIKINVSVLALTKGLQAIVHGMSTWPTESATAGLAPSDLAKIRAFLQEIPVADATQETAKDQRKAQTAIRDVIHRSIYGKMNRLRIVTGLELADDPVAQAEILNPFPNSPKPKKTAKPKTVTPTPTL